MTDRPDVAHGQTRKIKTGCGNIYVTLNEDDSGTLFEIFCKIGKAGGGATSWAESIGRMITLAMRRGEPLSNLIKQLRGISCHQSIGLGPKRVLSCSDAIGVALDAYARKKGILGSNAEADPIPVPVPATVTQGACPDCGGHIRMEEGCKKCICGWTEC